MKPKAFNFYLDYDENIEALSDAEVGQLTRALLKYARTGELPEMSPIVRVAFTPMRKQMDVEFAHYEEKAQALSEAGKRGAKKRWQMASDDMCQNRVVTIKDNHPITSDSHPTENKNENDNKDKKREQKASVLMFERFWNVYPKRVAKQTALKSFLKLKVTEELLQQMITALEQQIKSEQWQDARYIPNPSTWLNQERWNDELPKASSTKKYGNYIEREPKTNDRFGLDYITECN